MLRRVALTILLVVLAVRTSAAFTVSADVSPRDLEVGESATLTITINGVQDATPPDLGAVDGFELTYVGPSTQVSIVNGQVTAKVQHRFSLTAQRPGRFSVGPFTVTHAAESAKTAAVPVQVRAATAAPPGGTAPQAQGSDPDPQGLRLELATPKQEVYVNEPLPVDVTLYVGAVRATDVQYPTLPGNGLLVEKFPEPTQRQQMIDGTAYQVVRFHTTVVPLRPGAQTLGPAAMRMNLLQRRRGRTRNDPFEGFFDDAFFSEKRQVELRSNDVPITVLPLPEAGRPADFSGAVGQFSLTVTATPAEVTAGDPVTVRMSVSGSGYLGEALPRLADIRGFKAYDPAVTASDTTPARASKSLEQVLVPTDATVQAVPPVRFTFFDPAARQYRTVDSQPVALVVRPAAGAATPQVVAGGPATRDRAPEQLGQDIVYIKDAPGALEAGGPPGPSVWLLLWLPVPVGLFAAAAHYDRRRRLLHGDPRYARFSRAGRDARAGLATAAAEAAAENRAGFYDTLSRTLQSYLAAKLELPPGAVDTDAIAGRGVTPDTLELVRAVFTACEHARFSPGTGGENLQDLLSKAQEVVRRLERTRSYGARLAVGALLVMSASVGLPALVGAATANEPAAPQTAFFEGNSAYRAGDYRRAIAAYEQVRAGGHASGALYFNLGNAYFKDGDRGRAILNYQRARELTPRDPDLLANLAYVESVAGIEPCTPALWERVAFPLATRLTRAGLLWAAVAAYTACFLCLALRRLLPSRPTWTVWSAAALGVFALWLGATSVYRELAHRAPAAVAVGAGEIPVRFEPAATGTVHFSAREGTLLRIEGDRDGWVQVGRCDGRRGWIEANAVAPLWPEDGEGG